MPVGLHFHGPAAPGTNAGVVVNIGNISGLSNPSVGSTTVTAEDVAEILAGLWYINLHTALNPSGEIRGQVSVGAPVPLPGAAPLALGALVSLVAVARRKRRAASPQTQAATTSSG